MQATGCPSGSVSGRRHGRPESGEKRLAAGEGTVATGHDDAHDGDDGELLSERTHVSDGGAYCALMARARRAAGPSDLSREKESALEQEDDSPLDEVEVSRREGRWVETLLRVWLSSRQEDEEDLMVQHVLAASLIEQSGSLPSSPSDNGSKGNQADLG